MISSEFITLAGDTANFLQNTKSKCNAFDICHPSVTERILFIEDERQAIFNQLDTYFSAAWHVLQKLDRESYREYQLFYQEKLVGLLGSDIEINTHIYKKPLGYAGDFITMNYIYDYHHNNYLGSTSYEMLINNYTCTIPFSRSNIKRKDYFKNKILKTLREEGNPKILSVGCGSVRELLELLKENKITKPLTFTCIDFEKRALDYIRSEIAQIDIPNKQHLSISLVEQDIFSLIDNQKMTSNLGENDLIYASGLFDYLRRNTAKSLLSLLYTLLKKEGSLIVCNASLNNNSHRAYIETLGEWHMIYRTEEEMLAWTKGYEGEAAVFFERPQECPSYLFLNLKKNG
ncbi:MAG: hypothetical protein AB1805_05290 [Nitrospirota bacterium]